jgi:hypothetical protein
MNRTRALVTAGALMFAGFGINGLLRPESVLDMMQAEAGHATTFNELRAMYGGFELGVAAFLVACLRDRWSLDAGVFLLAAIFVSAAASRALSLVLDDVPSQLFLTAWIVEILFAGLCLKALSNNGGR